VRLFDEPDAREALASFRGRGRQAPA
jgi:hypothetical protein